MDLAQALAPEPSLRWLIGRVAAVTGNTLTMTYRGGTVENVGVLDQYLPVVGDVVHVLASDMNGMLAIGCNNQPTVLPVPSTPAAPVTVASTAIGTYRISTGAWSPGEITESPDQVGIWIYPAFTSVSGFVVLPVATLTIRVTATSDQPLEFILHQMVTAGGSLLLVAGSSYRVTPPPVGVPTDVQLPLEWASMLILHGALGIGVGGGDYTATLTGSSGLLTFTPLL